jgi:hypothetical protein
MGKRTTSNQNRTVVTKGTNDIAKETAPDVCKVPGKGPKSFENWVRSSMLKAGATQTTRIDGHPVVTKKGELGPLSNPAHEGLGGGVRTGKYRWEAQATSWSKDVYVEGEPVVRTYDTTHQNHRNTEGQILPASMEGVLPGTADCKALWAKYDAEAFNIIKGVDHNHRLRNHVIVGAWSDAYLDNREFHWMGMAAYASKQVGCGMDSALAQRDMGQDLRSTPWWVPGGQTARDLGTAQAAGAQYTYNALGDTNREVFLDAYPMHRFYAEQGFAKLQACASARPGMSQEALKGFEYLERFKETGDRKWLTKSSEQLLLHEQIKVIQPLAYDRFMMRRILDTQRVAGGRVPGIPAMQLTLTTACEGGGRLTIPLRGDLYQIPDRMHWIFNEVGPVYEDVFGTPQHVRDLEFLRTRGSGFGGVYPSPGPGR